MQYLKAEDFRLSRIDLAADIEGLTMEIILATMHIKRIHNFSVINGTIYAGSNPKFRIYDKVKEIKSRIKKGERITKYEKGLLESGKSYVRFEVEIRNVKKNLQTLKDDPLSLVQYFDRLEFFKLDAIEPCGIMQYMYPLVNRKFRKQLEEFNDVDLVERIKAQCKKSLIEWFREKEPF